MDNSTLFGKMLEAMVGDEEMADLLNWHEDESHPPSCGCPECGDWEWIMAERVDPLDNANYEPPF